MTTSTDSQQQIVLRLLNIISGELPISESDALLHTEVDAYMDDKKIASGQNAWKKWVLFLRHTAHKNGIKNLRIVVDSIHSTEEQVTVNAKWHGEVNGKELTSALGCVIYSVHDNKITAIQTHKTNYIFIYGKKITNPLFFYTLLLRVMFFRAD